jgi:hypothetical protein
MGVEDRKTFARRSPERIKGSNCPLASKRSNRPRVADHLLADLLPSRTLCTIWR